MVLLGALLVAAVVVPIVALARGLVIRRGRPAPLHPDQRLSGAARRAAQTERDEARIETDRLRGRQWPM